MTKTSIHLEQSTQGRSVEGEPAGEERPFKLHGTLLTVGAGLWAAATTATGINPQQPTPGPGSGRLAAVLLKVEAGLVTLAMASTLADAFRLSDLRQPGWALLDAFWPPSMVGMFLIAIRVAIAGHWKGVSQFWPLLAESWAVVVIPTMALFGYPAASIVSVLHLLIGYAALGQIVTRKRLTPSPSAAAAGAPAAFEIVQPPPVIPASTSD